MNPSNPPERSVCSMNPSNPRENDPVEEVLEKLDGANPDSYVYLTDEDGNEFPFEFLDVITYQDEDFGIFFPAQEEDDDADQEEVVILKVIPHDDGSVDFVSIDDEDTLNAVFDLFLENLRQQFALETDADDDDEDEFATGVSEK